MSKPRKIATCSRCKQTVYLEEGARFWMDALERVCLDMNPHEPEAGTVSILPTKPFAATVVVRVEIDPEAYEMAYGNSETAADMLVYTTLLITGAAKSTTLPEWLTVKEVDAP